MTSSNFFFKKNIKYSIKKKISGKTLSSLSILFFHLCFPEANTLNNFFIVATFLLTDCLQHLD